MCDPEVEQEAGEHRPPQTGCRCSSPGRNQCAACGLEIHDRVLLEVNERRWHARCLACSVCGASLQQSSSCYMKDTEVYCRLDYFSRFGSRCARCGRQVFSRDWVRRARGGVYHLACFSCFSCRRQLSTGEEFGLVEGHVLCRSHYDVTLENLRRAADSGTRMTLEEALPSDQDCQPRPAKRARTSFSTQQLQVMQSLFAQDNNPDTQTLQQLTELTGLSRRVIQVWFQNCRARHKKQPPPLLPPPALRLPPPPLPPAPPALPPLTSSPSSFSHGPQMSRSPPSLLEDPPFSPFSSPEQPHLLYLHGHLEAHSLAAPGHLTDPSISLPQLPISR